MFRNDATEVIVLDIPDNRDTLASNQRNRFKDIRAMENPYRSISGSSDRYATDPVKLLFCKYLHGTLV